MTIVGMSISANGAGVGAAARWIAAASTTGLTGELIAGSTSPVVRSGSTGAENAGDATGDSPGCARSSIGAVSPHSTEVSRAGVPTAGTSGIVSRWTEGADDPATSPTERARTTGNGSLIGVTDAGGGTVWGVKATAGSAWRCPVGTTGDGATGATTSWSMEDVCTGKAVGSGGEFTGIAAGVEDSDGTETVEGADSPTASICRCPSVLSGTPSVADIAGAAAGMSVCLCTAGEAGAGADDAGGTEAVTDVSAAADVSEETVCCGPASSLREGDVGAEGFPIDSGDSSPTEATSEATTLIGGTATSVNGCRCTGAGDEIGAGCTSPSLG